MHLGCDICKLVCKTVRCSLPTADPTQCYYQSYALTHLDFSYNKCPNFFVDLPSLSLFARKNSKVFEIS